MNGIPFKPPPTESSGASDPPPTIEDQRELFFPVRPFRFYPLDFGLAVGIGAALFMLFYIFITFWVNRFGAGTASLVFFEQIFPGFHLDFTASRGGIILSTIIGMVWSFVSGFVLGFLFGFIYNLRLRNYVLRRARQG